MSCGKLSTWVTAFVLIFCPKARPLRVSDNLRIPCDSGSLALGTASCRT